jgi:hypothetical protein
MIIGLVSVYIPYDVIRYVQVPAYTLGQGLLWEKVILEPDSSTDVSSKLKCHNDVRTFIKPAFFLSALTWCFVVQWTCLLISWTFLKSCLLPK